MSDADLAAEEDVDSFFHHHDQRDADVADRVDALVFVVAELVVEVARLRRQLQPTNPPRKQARKKR